MSLLTNGAVERAPVEPAEAEGRLSYGDAARPAHARVLVYDHRARLLRAARDLFMCWAGSGAAAIALPFANLLLVPVLFVAGVWLFIRELRTPVGLRGVDGICPACDLEQHFEPTSSRLHPRVVLQCPNCHRPLAFALDPESLKPEAAAA